MASKRVYLAFAVVALVFLYGCTGGGKQPTAKTTPFCGGLDGVEMGFVEGSPPSEVFDGAQFPFDVTLRLFNKGEHPIEANEARIELSGISSVDFGGPDYVKVVSERLTSTHKDQEGNCVNGDPVHITFGGAGEEPFKYRHSLPGNTQFTLRADICYRYKTNSTVQFCVQKELPRFGQEPTCRVDEIKTVSNSGAPLHIEEFKQSPGGQDRIAFTFSIVHKGTGAVHSGALCDSSFQNRNRVHVKVSSRVGSVACTSLNGGNEGDVIIVDSKRVINCVLGTAGIAGREFETPINIELGFNYKQHEDATILVKHLG